MSLVLDGDLRPLPSASGAKAAWQRDRASIPSTCCAARHGGMALDHTRDFFASSGLNHATWRTRRCS